MIEVELYEALKSLAGGRVFWGVAPQETAAPWIILTKVSGVYDWTLTGPSGARRYMVQLDCYAATPQEALELSASAFDALTAPGLPLGVGPANELPASYEHDTGLHRASVEYQIQT